MMPSVIGTRQATRAVVDGTMKRDDEADQDRADHHVPGFGADARQEC